MTSRLQHVRLSWCLSLCMPLCMPVSACACRQTDHPQTVGTLLPEEVSERREADRWMIHARTIDCLVQRSDDVTQAAIDLKWYRSSSQLAMQAYLYVVYGQRWRDKSLYCATFDLYQAHERTMRACVSPSLHSQLQLPSPPRDDGDWVP